MRITTLDGFDVIRVEKQPKCQSLNIFPFLEMTSYFSPFIVTGPLVVP